MGAATQMGSKMTELEKIQRLTYVNAAIVMLQRDAALVMMHPEYAGVELIWRMLDKAGFGDAARAVVYPHCSIAKAARDIVKFAEKLGLLE